MSLAKRVKLSEIFDNINENIDTMKIFDNINELIETFEIRNDCL